MVIVIPSLMDELTSDGFNDYIPVIDYINDSKNMFWIFSNLHLCYY